MQFSKKNRMAMLVGDNPFHGISHLSQERARSRVTFDPQYAADLINTSIQNGANGFMFSVSETTLSILRSLRKMEMIENLDLYAIVPYAFEYVRLATLVGGIEGLARRLAKELVLSRNVKAMVRGLDGLLEADPISLMEAYLLYELKKVKSSAGKHSNLVSLILHEVVTDLALALDLEWLFREYVDFVSKRKITPGFNTCNFVYLAMKFKDWHLDLSHVVIAAPFNKIGFQMNPSREECEKVLAEFPPPGIIAISILAAGHLNPSEAIGYLSGLPNLRGIAVGVSKMEHACQTFNLLMQKFG